MDIKDAVQIARNEANWLDGYLTGQKESTGAIIRLQSLLDALHQAHDLIDNGYVKMNYPETDQTNDPDELVEALTRRDPIKFEDDRLQFEIDRSPSADDVKRWALKSAGPHAYCGCSHNCVCNLVAEDVSCGCSCVDEHRRLRRQLRGAKDSIDPSAGSACGCGGYCGCDGPNKPDTLGWGEAEIPSSRK